MARIRSSIWATFDGVNPLPTSERIRVWRGGSRARNDITLWASGPKALGSRETPWALEKPSTLRKAAEHVLVAGQGPEVELVVPVQRGLGPQAGVDRVGVLVDLVGVGAVDDRLG